MPHANVICRDQRVCTELWALINRPSKTDDWLSCRDYFYLTLTFGDGSSVRRLGTCCNGTLYVADNDWDTIDNDPNYSFDFDQHCSETLRRALNHLAQTSEPRVDLVIHPDGRIEEDSNGLNEPR